MEKCKALYSANEEGERVTIIPSGFKGQALAVFEDVAYNTSVAYLDRSTFAAIRQEGNMDTATFRAGEGALANSVQPPAVSEPIITPEQIREELSYMYDRIDWGSSAMDARAITIMNTLQTRIIAEIERLS